jgi:hypothetical protein
MVERIYLEVDSIRATAARQNGGRTTVRFGCASTNLTRARLDASGMA